VTDTDPSSDPTRAVYRQAGFTGGLARGRRPAVLVLDFSRGGPSGANLSDMTAKYADACTAEEVVGHLQELPSAVAG
jgi:hypothetical protein